MVPNSEKPIEGLFRPTLRGALIFGLLSIPWNIFAFNTNGEPHADELRGFLVWGAVILDDGPVHLLPPGVPLPVLFGAVAIFAGVMGAALGLVCGAAARTFRLRRDRKTT